MSVGKGKQRWARCLVIAGFAISMVGGSVAYAGVADDRLAAGDCIDGWRPGTNPSPAAGLVPCIVPHDVEVVAVFYLNGKFPGREKVWDMARDLCRPAIRAAVSQTQLSLIGGWLVPDTEGSWNHDASIPCAVAQENGAKLIGGYVGSPRIPSGSSG